MMISLFEIARASDSDVANVRHARLRLAAQDLISHSHHNRFGNLSRKHDLVMHQLSMGGREGRKRRGDITEFTGL